MGCARGQVHLSCRDSSDNSLVLLHQQVALRLASSPALEEHYYGRLTRNQVHERFGLAALRATIVPAAASIVTALDEPAEGGADAEGGDT